jgi:hypothetical protein
MTTNLRIGRRVRDRYLLALVLCVAPASASAQPTPPPGGIAPPARPERPYRGLFGNSVGNTAQSLTVEGKLGGGYVQNPLGEQGATIGLDDRARGGGASGVGSAIVEYAMNRTRFGAHAAYTMLMDYYPQLAYGSLQDRHVASASIYYMPAKSTRISFTESFKNFPEFSVSDLFDPGQERGISFGQDFQLSPVRYIRYGSSVEVSQTLSGRTHISGGLDYAHGKVEDREWVILTGSATLTHNVGKGMSVYMGYQEGGQRDVTTDAPSKMERQPRINAGLDFHKPLSLSRRTWLSFSTGVAGTQDIALGQTVYNLVGTARLGRELGQTWIAELTYSRNVRRIEAIAQSILADSVTVGANGSFSRRVQYGSHINYSFGRDPITGSMIKTLFGGVQLSAAITRQVAWGTDYAYSRYSIDEGFLPVEALAMRNGQSLRTYLQVWVPLLKRTKG